VDEIIVPDEPADETDDDFRWHRAGHGRGNSVGKDCVAKCKDDLEGKDRSANQNTQST
jgi:hypothetical protein